MNHNPDSPSPVPSPATTSPQPAAPPPSPSASASPSPGAASPPAASPPSAASTPSATSAASGLPAGLCPAGWDLLAEGRRLRHLMRELVRVGLDLRACPAAAFPLVKVAEAERVLLGVLVQVATGGDAWLYERMVKQVVAIVRDKRRSLIDALSRVVRVPLLGGLEASPPSSEEVWAAARELRRRNALETFAGRALPLSDTQARALADALRARASSPATWEELWQWS